MALTTQQIINIAKVSQYIADNAKAKGSLYGQPVDPLLALKLYTIRKDLEWMFDIDPTNEDIVPVQNYLYMMCLPAAAALITSGGGSSVTPGTVQVITSPIRITGADFASATAWDGTNSDGITISASYTLQVFWNDIQRFLEPGEWTRTQSGFTVDIPGFDATTTNLTSVFYVYISI